MGGIGKTSLAARLAQQVAPRFEYVYWRSLRDALPTSEWLGGAISFLSEQQVVPPPTDSERFTVLLQLLRTRHCLLVLDNFDTLFEPGQREGRYRSIFSIKRGNLPYTYYWMASWCGKKSCFLPFVVARLISPDPTPHDQTQPLNLSPGR